MNIPPTLEDLKKLELEKKRFKLALKHNICPKCSKTLLKTKEYGDFCEVMVDYDYIKTIYKCNSCTFEHIINN